jgi:competence protein CoiA
VIEYTSRFFLPMLSAKRKSDGQLVHAYFERKSGVSFLCPECNEVVVLKIGKSRINHFAHLNPLPCKYGQSESEAHRRCKMELYEALSRERGVENVKIERSLGAVRPDVSALIHGIPVAFEIQMSSLSSDEILNRTIWYHRKGIYVLWLLQWTAVFDAPRFRPKVWQRWIHAAYFGRVYCWVKGLEVVSYSFEPSLKSIPKRSWWKNGKRASAGGFTRRLLRYRKGVRGKIFNLATDFAPRDGFWWEGGGLKLPDRRLFMERGGSMDLHS